MILLKALGLITLGLAIAGAFLPILPTTPFVLLSAYFFSKSSPKFHAWILNHPVFGSMVRDWQEQGAVSKKAKVFATISLVSLFTISFLAVPLNGLIKSILLVIGLSVLIFIWTRPDSAPESL